MTPKRRQRGEGAVFQRHDHPTCPPRAEVHDQTEEAMTDLDYLKPVRDAAGKLADEISPDRVEAIAIRDALIGYAGAILDAVRAEADIAMREANLKAIDRELSLAEPTRDREEWKP